MTPSARYITKSTFQGILGVGAVAAMGVIVSGRWDYVQGWLVAGVYAALTPIMIVAFRDKESLMKERRRPGPGVKLWDRIIVQLLKLAMVGVYAVGALDAGRHGWSPALPLWSYPLSLAALAGSTCFSVWAMATNDFFSSHVRIQTDRGHAVADRGPYAFVRHPGYTAMNLSLPATAFALGSLWALLPALAGILILILRTALEDRTLRAELDGYAEYAKRVRYRLVPGVW